MQSFKVFGLEFGKYSCRYEYLKICESESQSHYLTSDLGFLYFDSFKQHLKSHWVNCNQVSCKATLD